MTTASVSRLALLASWVLTAGGTAGCTESKYQGPGDVGGAGTSMMQGAQGASSGGAPAVPGNAGAAAPVAGSGAAPVGGASAAGSGAGAAGGTAGSAPGNTPGTAEDGGVSDASNDGADAAVEPVGDPDLGSVGLGSGGVAVSDLEMATKFFVELVGMKVQSDVQRDDHVERVLTLGPAGKPTLTLMHYDDGRNTKDLPAKMVFYAQSPSAAISKIRDGGYDVILSGAIGVGQVYGFDGYVLEFLQDPSGPMFISIAFAVTDLNKTVKLYTDVFGLMSTGSYYAGTLQEEFVQAPAGGAALVVQHYTSGNVNYMNNPVKSVWHVADAAATSSKIVELGGTMVRAAAPLPAFNNRVTAIAKDFDGYVIEVIQ